MYLLYLIRNEINGKVYIGQTNRSLKRRWAQHLCSSRHKLDNYIAKAIRHYGPQSFRMFEIGHAETLTDIDALECAAIAFFHSTEHQFGYNLESGGNGKGQVHASTRAKLSARMAGRIISEETKQKLRSANIGKGGVNWTPEARRKLSDRRKSDPKLIAQLKAIHESARGKPLSDAHRLALHLAKKRRSKQLWLI